MSVKWQRESGTSPRQRSAFQSAKLEGWVHVSLLGLDKELQELGVCSTLFLSGFVAVISSLCHHASLWNGTVHSAPLYIGSMKFN